MGGDVVGRLDGRVAFVTGGSRGIGAAIVTAFAREGAAVAFTYRSREDRALAVAAEVEALGGTAMPIQADASIEDDTRRAIDATVARFGRINILVNNAGTIGDEIRIVDLPIAEWDRLIATDLRGVFVTTKLALPHIPTEPIGKIINIGSELALKGRAGYAHYCAAKGGVIAFTYALAHEVAPGICANVLAPGPIATDMILADMAPEWIEKEKDIPAQRLGTPEEMAQTAVLLASDAGNFFIGQVLSPNGGAVFR